MSYLGWRFHPLLTNRSAGGNDPAEAVSRMESRQIELGLHGGLKETGLSGDNIRYGVYSLFSLRVDM